MKKWKIVILVLGFLFLLGGILILQNERYRYYLGIRNENSLEPNPSEPVLAVFSFTPNSDNSLLQDYEHYKILLSTSPDLDFPESISQNGEKRPVMVTVEIWGEILLQRNYRSPLYDIPEGSYDLAIRSLCEKLSVLNRPVYLRFNPEMDVPGLYYTWQNNPLQYIDAFKHFTKLCRRYAPRVSVVWAPAGYPGAMEYYPGNEFVDVASITLKSNSEMTRDEYPRDLKTPYDTFRRLHRLRFLSTPIFILGSDHSSNDEINPELLEEISQTVETNRDVIYSTENFRPPQENWALPREESLKFGFYDPNELLVNEPAVDVEHLFADFGNLADGSFHERFKRVQQRNHELIVTFEPFRHPESDYDPEVLEKITAGLFDTELDSLFAILLSTDKTLYLRYAHEMEIPIHRYPWQSKNPVTYIKSFRYFMQYADSLPPHVKKVWGPAGDRGSAEWYPGDDVVDLVSMAIYGLPDKNISDPEKQESFATIFKRKLRRMRFINKPIFITEFGVKGPEEYQTHWLLNAAGVIRENSRVIGVNYFNMTDTPKAWGDIKPPDWSISKNSFHQFLEALRKPDDPAVQ